MKKLYLNPDLFFLIEEDGSLLAWNYARHEQYTLERKYFDELCFIAREKKHQNSVLSEELLAANLILDEKPTLFSWGWDVLSKIFHLGTQNPRKSNHEMSSDVFVENYLSACDEVTSTIPSLFTQKTGKTVVLPEPILDEFKKTSFYHALKARKTCREFKREHISLQTLSNVLFASFGLLHGKAWEEFEGSTRKPVGIRKASPASGGLHVEEAYLLIYRVDGLAPGLYHYDCDDHRLTELTLGHFEKTVIEMNFNQFYSEGLSFGLYVTARFDKLWWKYRHSRSYRAALLDVGHVSQTFLLAATACGLSTWITAAFHDVEVDEFLGLDSHESALLYLGAGLGTGSSFPPIMRCQSDKKTNEV